jgi:hypothetical protein
MKHLYLLGSGICAGVCICSIDGGNIKHAIVTGIFSIINFILWRFLK